MIFAPAYRFDASLSGARYYRPALTGLALTEKRLSPLFADLETEGVSCALTGSLKSGVTPTARDRSFGSPFRGGGYLLRPRALGSRIYRAPVDRARGYPTS